MPPSLGENELDAVLPSKQAWFNETLFLEAFDVDDNSTLHNEQYLSGLLAWFLFLNIKKLILISLDWGAIEFL